MNLFRIFHKVVSISIAFNLVFSVITPLSAASFLAPPLLDKNSLETVLVTTPNDAARIILDWTCEQQEIPQNYDLLWIMGSRFTRVAYETAKKWRQKHTKVIITGGIGRETPTLKEVADRENKKVIKQINKTFNNLAKLREKQGNGALWKKLNNKFGIIDNRDRKKLADPNRDSEHKTWQEFILKKGPFTPEELEKELKERSIEQIVVDSLLDKKTRRSMIIPEGFIYHAVLVSEGVDEKDIIVDAQSTTSVENIMFGAEALQRNAVNFKTVVLMQEPYMQRRGRLTFLKQFPKYYLWQEIKHFVAGHTPFTYDFESAPPEKWEWYIEKAMGEIERILAYPFPPKEAIIYEPIPQIVKKSYAFLLADIIMKGAMPYEKLEALSPDIMAEVLRHIPLGNYSLEQKMLIYSAPPASGKGSVEARGLKGANAPYDDLFGKFLLHHTRNPREGDKKQEFDGVAYHFGNADVGKQTNRLAIFLNDEITYSEMLRKRLESEGLTRKDVSAALKAIREHISDDLLSETGAKIYGASVNRQLQGMAISTFYDIAIVEKTTVLPDGKTNIYRSKTKKDDIVLIGKKAKDDDILVIDENKKSVVLRKIEGLSEAFGKEKMTLLEGGYDWAMTVARNKANIFTIFLSPMSEEQLVKRAEEKLWINREFTTPQDRIKAFYILTRIRKEQGKEDINLALDVKLQKNVKREVIKRSLSDIARKDKGPKGPNGDTLIAEGFENAKQNARVIERKEFLIDLNTLIRNIFDDNSLTIISDEAGIARITNENKKKEARLLQAKARMLGYEVLRRLVWDRGKASYAIERPTAEALKSGDFTKPQDAYNRMLEGVGQILLQKNYPRSGKGALIENHYVWSGDKDAINKRLDEVAHQFCSEYFTYVLHTISLSSNHTFQLISDKFFSGDDEALLESLFSWRAVYREKTGNDISFQELLEDALFPITNKKGEYLYQTSSSGRKIPVYRPRKVCKIDGSWYRTIGVIAIDKNGKIAVQSRSRNRLLRPLARDISASGYMGVDTDPVTAAQRELEEELFNGTVLVDRSRLFRLTPEGKYISTADENDTGKENATFFAYFITDREKELINLQSREVEQKSTEDLFVKLQTEINKFNRQKKAGTHTKGYSNGFTFFDEYKTKSLINGTPQNIFRKLLAKDSLSALSAVYNNGKTLSSPKKDIVQVPEDKKTTAVLNESIKLLEKIIIFSGDINLINAFQQNIIGATGNKGPPLTVILSEHIGTFSEKKVASMTGKTELIIDRKHIKGTCAALNHARYNPSRRAEILLQIASNIFHVMARSGDKTSLRKYTKEEFRILENDRLLSIAIRKAGFNTDVIYPEQMRTMFDILADPEIVSDFNIFQSEVESLEREAEKVFKNNKDHSINKTKTGPTCKARDERIERAFVSGDPDYFGDNTSKRLSRKESLDNTFLGFLRDFLTQRAVSQGRESFLFLAQNTVTVVPFNQLKDPRVPPFTKGVLLDMNNPDEVAVEKKRSARQYYAMHKGRRFSDGIGVTEAENGRGMEQRWHQHETTQEFTTSLCENTIFRVGRRLEPNEQTRMETKTVKGEEIEVEIVADGIDKDKEVVTAEDKDKKMKLVVIREELIPFASMIAIPKKTFHTLANTRDDIPSIDFTVKDPVTQVIKTFSPSEEIQLHKAKILKPSKKSRPWGSIYEHTYLNSYNTNMSVDPQTGEYEYQPDEQGTLIPVMHDSAMMKLRIVEVKPGKTSDKFDFSSLYPDENTQIVRIFPWPRKINKDWVLDRDHASIKAEVVTYANKGKVLSRAKGVQGGDLVLLDNNKSGNKISSYAVKNTSKKHTLVFFVLEVAERTGEREHVYSNRETISKLDSIFGLVPKPSTFRESELLLKQKEIASSH